ncbi:MAG: DUF3667 domain-containing protein [Sediminicola sp.]
MEQQTTPATGRFQLKYRGNECLNCGHPLDLSDKYCPNCSQANSMKKLSIMDFFDEFFNSIISYDSKLLRTLYALLLRPGRITRDYIQGKRVSYTNPFRFLLSLAFVYFLMINAMQNFDEIDSLGGNFQKRELDNNINTLTGKIPFDSEQEKQEALKDLDSINLAGNFLDPFGNERDSIILSDPAAYFTSLEKESKGYLSKIEYFAILLQHAEYRNFKELSRTYKIPETYQNRKSYDIAKGILRAADRPGSYLSYIISKLPFAIFFFLPVFALFIWFLYIRKKYNYTDHLIFSFHNQSLLFILLIISYILDLIFKVESNGIFLLIFAFYLYKAMRNFYGQGRIKTIVKYMILNTVFFILAMFSLIILFTGSIFTY